MNKNDKIENVLLVFSDYINSIPYIDIVTSKFGYLFLMEITSNSMSFDIKEIDSAEKAFDYILDFMVQDFLFDMKSDSDKIPKEYVSAFRNRVEVYLRQLPKYAYILDNYIDSTDNVK